MASQPHEPRGYSRAAVSRALARLDPADPDDAQLMIALSDAVAAYVTADRRLGSPPTDDGSTRLIGELGRTAHRIDALTGAVSSA